MLTALSLFVMFSVYEASELKSFGRYLNCYHLILFNYIVFMFCYFVNTDFRYKKYFNIILMIIIVFIPFAKLSYFFTDFSERYNTEFLSNLRKDYFIDSSYKI